MDISCIIPVGPDNIEYLLDAVDSATESRCFAEIILCVSGAVEFAHSIQHLSNYHRLVVSYENSIGYQKNLAIVNAKHDWIATLDSDDLIDADGFSKLKLSMVAESVDGPAQDVYFAQVHEFGMGVDHSWPESGTVNIDNLHNQNCVPVSAIFRKKMWWSLGGFHHVRYEDWHFWKRAKDYGFKFSYDGDYVFYHHRRHLNSVGGKTGWDSSLGHEL